MNRHYNSEIYPSAARTATPTVVDLKVPDGCLGLLLMLNVSAGSTLSLTLKVRARDPISNQIVQLGATAAITGVSVNRLTIYPGVTPVELEMFRQHIGDDLVREVTHGNANSATYSVSACFIP